MYREIKFEFQSAAREGAAGEGIPAEENPRIILRLPFPVLLTHHPPLGATRSNDRSHAMLIVTPRLEFRATPTKQSPNHFSNRYKSHFSHVRLGGNIRRNDPWGNELFQ